MERSAIFPGSFDPFTRGHAALVDEALNPVSYTHLVAGEMLGDHQRPRHVPGRHGLAQLEVVVVLRDTDVGLDVGVGDEMCIRDSSKPWPWNLS